jgi:H+/Cl- antiporter ClcA
MIRRRVLVLEESILFISIIKWFLLASIVGVLVGLSTTIFLKVLEISISFATQYKYYFFLLPVSFFLSSLLTEYIAPEAKGHGTEKVIESVHKRSGKINPLVVPIKLIATVVTIALGGSAGKEGPCAQIGAGLSSILSDVFKFNESDRKKLVICGISAGFATVFGTPIAGAIFGVEVLIVGSLLYDVLFPSFVAGIVGYQVASFYGITYFYEPLNFVPTFSSLLFTKVCFSGIFFGFCSFIFIEMMKYIEQANKKIPTRPLYKGLIGGAVLVILTILLSTQFLGLGLETIKSSLEGEYINPLAFLGKMLFTSVTLAFGGSGGIVTPIFFIGATSGNTFANLFGMDIAMFSAIGMVALLAGAANTPISASIMAVELFGPAVAPYAAVACVISFLMTGHRSVYPSQVLVMTKSPTLVVEKGKEMEHIEYVQVKPRPKSITETIVKISKKIKSKGREETK